MMSVRFPTRALRGRTVLAIGLAIGLLQACGGADVEHNYPRTGPDGPTYKKRESVLGDQGLNLFGNSSPEDAGSSGGIGVNSFLWRATLDTIAFMPLQSADPFGGIILTDWYAPPEAGGERFKVSVYILDRRLRTDAVNARIFRQQRNADGSWRDETANPDLDRQLEDRILTRARQLRIDSEPARK